MQQIGDYMFDNPYSFVSLFIILIAVAHTIFRSQLIKSIVNGFKKRGKEKNKYDADELRQQRLEDQLNNILTDEKMLNLNDASFKIELLKIVNLSDHYTVYFFVDGGTIFLKSITSRDIKITEFEPRGYLQNKSSGHFIFTKTNSTGDRSTISITFEDQFTVNHSKKYLLSISENIFEEIV